MEVNKRGTGWEMQEFLAQWKQSGELPTPAQCALQLRGCWLGLCNSPKAPDTGSSLGQEALLLNLYFISSVLGFLFSLIVLFSHKTLMFYLFLHLSISVYVPWPFGEPPIIVSKIFFTTTL